MNKFYTYLQLYINLFCNVFLIVIGLSCLSSCATVHSLSDIDAPIWMRQTVFTPLIDHGGGIKVLSYNIKYAKEIDEAVLAFKQSEQLLDAEIILLQEMDTTGTMKMAEELEMNFVYIPAVIHGKDSQYFGNSILSKWPIEKVEKIILPHQTKSGRQRIGLYALIDIDGIDLHVYNVHLETMTMKRKKRTEQLKAILDHSENLPKDEAIIVAGDFNSFFPKDRKVFSDEFEEYGFLWYSEDLKYTAKALMGLLSPAIDHVFGKGIEVDGLGVENRVKASDHFPVYFNFHFDQ